MFSLPATATLLGLLLLLVLAWLRHVVVSASGRTGQMNPLDLQPTFTMSVPDSADTALAKLRRAIRAPEFGGLAESAGPCLDFKIARAERRLWSPHLSVQLSDQADGAELYCRFSPRPEIWTGVMMTYFAAAFVLFVAAVYGYVQWFLGSPPWALVAIPCAAVAIAGLHGASLVGQQLSADQMLLLRSRLDRAVELAFDNEPALSSTKTTSGEA